MQHFIGLLVIISSAKLLQALEQCQVSSLSVYGHHLAKHVISTRICSSLSDCIILCSKEFRCKSLNFRLKDKSCALNDADRFTDPDDYGPKAGFIYMDTSEKHKKNDGFKSCAEIHQEFPEAQSGYYWVKIGNRDVQVYCDMDNHGGGWTLVVSISSKNNDHLQSTANNCFNSVLCVPAHESVITARKLSDEDIHKLALSEGTFRVDVRKPVNNDTLFYQIPSGPENFESSCASEQCPRIIISGSYPYKWETNSCTSIDRGYRIAPGGCHRVFDGHDNGECGGRHWQSTSYKASRRALYGYPCPALPRHDSLGIYHNSDGILYVK